MCWRGHDPSRTVAVIWKGQKRFRCKECHRITVRLYRRGRKPFHKNIYLLNVKEIDKIKNRKKMRAMIEMQGISIETFYCWYLGKKRNGDLSKTSKESAVKLSQALNIPFDKLWVLSI